MAFAIFRKHFSPEGKQESAINMDIKVSEEVRKANEHMGNYDKLLVFVTDSPIFMVVTRPYVIGRRKEDQIV